MFETLFTSALPVRVSSQYKGDDQSGVGRKQYEAQFSKFLENDIDSDKIEEMYTEALSNG